MPDANSAPDPFANGNPFAAIGFADGSMPPPAPASSASSPSPAPNVDDDPSAMPPLVVTRGPPLASPPAVPASNMPPVAAPTAATVPSSAPPGPGPSSGSPTSSGPADPFAGGSNPFAQIGVEDDQRQQVSPSSPGAGPLANQPSDGFASGTLKNVGTTAIRGLSHVPGFVGDLSEFAGALGEIPDYVQSKITGEPFADINARHRAAAEDFRQKQVALDKSIFGFSTDPRSYFPSGSEVAAPILRQTGSYQPTTPLGRYGSAVGEAVIGGLGPGGGGVVKGMENTAPGFISGAARIGQGAIQHAPANALAGASSQAASQASGGDPLASALGGIGASTVAGAAHGLVAGAPVRKAAAVLAQGTTDREAALAAIKQGQADPIPGVQPTTAQLTNDPGVRAMQTAAAGTKARGSQFDARQQQQSRGLGNALDSLLPGGDPQQVATLFARRFDDIGNRTQALIDGHLSNAQAHADALRGQGLPVDASGTTLRSHLVDADAARRDAEGELWDSIDPDGRLTNDATGIKAATGQIYGQMPAADRAFMSPSEQTFAGLIGNMNDVEPFRQVAALKSNLASAMRQELRDNGRTPAYARMSRLMGPVQGAIDGTVSRKAAADNAAVAAGTMAPEDTLEAFIRSKSPQADAGRDAGSDISTRALGTGTGGPSAPAPATREGQRQQGRIPSTARASGISPDDVAGAAPQIGSSAPGAVRPIYHPGGTLGVRNELVEHGELITSHDVDFRARADYPQNLQPRARESAGARDQVNGMAARLNPERLGPSPEANAGAPIVGPDNVVESGSGRTMAIGKAYDAGGAQADAYRSHLEKLGYDTSGYARPVLVGRRVTPMTPDAREFFTHAANDATALRMGSAEQAAADASKITPSMLDAQVSPNITATANRPFVGGFMSKLPAAERGALVDGAGNLSQAGVRRIQAAMTAHAYGDRGVISRAFDDAEPNIKGLAGALTDASGPWAKMRNAVSDGLITPEHDVTPELMQGVKLAMRARDEGRPIGELLAQRDLFQSDTSRLVTAMLTKDGNRLASRPQIEANLRTYAEEALKNSSDTGLFGDAASVDDVLKAAQAKAARETNTTTSKLADGPMFSDVPPPATANMDAAAAARYKAANDATKERARLSGAKPVADVLAESGGRGNYKVPSSAVPGKFFFKGPGGFEKVQAFKEAVGDDQAAMHVLRDHALDDLQRTARTNDGTFDERKLDKWRADHEDALRAFPELATRFESAGAATRTLNEASAQRRDLIKAYEKSVFGKLMNASHPQEVNGIIGSALQRNDRVMVFRKLAKEASSDPMAMAGLRQAVLEHVVGKSVADIEGETGAARTLKAKQFLDLYKQTHLALKEVLGDRATARLGAIAQMAPRVSQAVEGASKSPKNLMRYLNTVAKPHESLMERMWKPALVMREFHELGGTLGGEWGEMLAGGVGAAALSKRLVSSIRATGARKVGDLITDALLDSEKYAALLAQAPTRPDTGSASTLAYQLRRASMYGGDAAARISAHLAARAPRLADRADDQRRQAERKPVRARGGGLLGMGKGVGPLGVPTYSQITGPGLKAAKAPFASGGTVGREMPEVTAARFQKDLEAMSASLKRERDVRAILGGSPQDPIGDALRVAAS